MTMALMLALAIQIACLCISCLLKVKVAQSCLCNPVDYTVHGVLQARIPGVGILSLLRRSSQPMDQTQVSHIAGRFFTS